MALSNLQQRVERSIFEAIRLILVAEGYIPDIADTGTFGTEPFSAANQVAWDAALATRVAAKGFAVEEYNHSLEPGTRKVPRIAIIPRRSMPGDLGSPNQPFYQASPIDPKTLVGVKLPLETTHFYFDIHLVSGSTAQGRVLNAVVGKALGNKKYIPYYDDPGSLLFIRQYNYYDIPDPIEGQEEKIYAYEVPDLYDVPDEFTAQSTIKEITLDGPISYTGKLTADGNPIDGFVKDAGIVIDLSGINFNP
jgi:hypothetical protein